MRGSGCSETAKAQATTNRQCKLGHRHRIIDDGLLAAMPPHQLAFTRIREPPMPGQLPIELLQSVCSHSVALPRSRLPRRCGNGGGGGGGRLPVDLAALIKCSDYFAALIRNVAKLQSTWAQVNDFDNNRELQLFWHHLPFLKSGFDSFVHFANGSALVVTDENVIDLYMTADYLISKGMRVEALRHLASRCAEDVSFALQLLSELDGLWLPELDGIAFDAVLAGFPVIAEATSGGPEPWLALSAELVHRVLSHDALNCQSEEQVLIAASRWLRANPESHGATLRLASCVRIGLLEPVQRERLAVQYPALMRWSAPLWSFWTSHWVHSIPDAALKCQMTNQAQAAIARPREPHEAVLVFGGWGQNPLSVAAAESTTDAGQNPSQQQAAAAAAGGPTGPQAACQVYNPRADRWILRCPNGQEGRRQGGDTAPNHIGQLGPRVYSGCLLVDDVVHVIGGFDGQRALRTVWRFDLRNPQAGWRVGSCMTRRRYFVCCAATNSGVMYAIGGHTGEAAAPVHQQQQQQAGSNAGRLSSVERLRPGEHSWMEIASLRLIRSDAGGAAIGERVFVAGGFDGLQYHDTAEAYDPAMNQWTLIGRMQNPRSGVALVAIGDAIYAVGGNDGEKRLRSIEKYIPGGPSDEWEEIGQMLQAKSNLSAVAIDGGTRLLSVGGWSDAGQPGVVASAETFCLRTGLSKPVADARFAASATVACVVRGRLQARRLLQNFCAQSVDSLEHKD